MSKHTPGPWKLDIYEEQNGDKHYFFKQDDKGEEDIIFNTSCPGLRDEDAHLIAAAPAMYLELKEGLVLLEASHHDMVDMYGIDSLQAKTVWERIESTRTALAQAEGRG